MTTAMNRYFEQFKFKCRFHHLIVHVASIVFVKLLFFFFSFSLLQSPGFD